LSVSEQGYKLNIRKFNNKESLSADAVLEVFGKNGYLYEQKITLPYSAVINPVAVAYRVTSGSLTDSITIKNKKICPVEYITQPNGNDSITVICNNPSGSSFWYTIWEGFNIIKKGYGSEMRFNLSKEKMNDYVMRLEYMEAGIINEFHTKLDTDLQNINIVEKPSETSYNSYVNVYRWNYTDKTTEEEFKKLSFPKEAFKLSKYEKILKSLQKRKALKYSSEPNMHFSYKNVEEHKPRYLMVLDCAKQKDSYERLEVYGADTKSVLLHKGGCYVFYILSDSTLTYRRPFEVKEYGHYWLTFDMDDLNYSPLLDKEVDYLLSPFSDGKFISVTVLDPHYDEPLIGATIRLAGTKVYGVADIDGKALLEIPAGFRGYIEISYVGMDNQRIEYKGQPELIVRMKDYPYLLD